MARCWGQNRLCCASLGRIVTIAWLVVNLGSDLHLAPAPEPLLAPPEGMDWTILWSSEDPRYGGDGVIPLEDEDNWHVPGHTAVVLRPYTRQGQEG
jgi:maltooligosyltrehalose trehalohydrolase